MFVDVVKLEAPIELAEFMRAGLIARDKMQFYFPPMENDLIERLIGSNAEEALATDYALFVAYDDNELVGRIAVFVVPSELEKTPENRIGYFGFFDSIADARATRLLFSEAEEWLAGMGVKTVFGPFNLTPLESFATVISGFEHPPFFEAPQNPPFYVDLIEACGYKKDIDLFSWGFRIRQNLWERIKQADDQTYDQSITIRCVDKAELGIRLKTFTKFFSTLGLPASLEFPATMYEDEKFLHFLAERIDTETSLLAEINGEPVALCIAVPNYYELISGLAVMPISLAELKRQFKNKISKIKSERIIFFGVSPTLNVDANNLADYLFRHHLAEARKKYYEEGEIAWVPESERQLNDNIRKLGGEIKRVYRVFRKDIG